MINDIAFASFLQLRFNTWSTIGRPSQLFGFKAVAGCFARCRLSLTGQKGLTGAHEQSQFGVNGIALCIDAETI